jgi:hypothetical protein
VADTAQRARAVGPGAPGPAHGRLHPRGGHRLHLHGVLHRAAGRHAGGRAPDRRQPRRHDVHDRIGAGDGRRHAGRPAPGRWPEAR